MNLYKVKLKVVTWNEHDGRKEFDIWYTVPAKDPDEAGKSARNKARDQGYNIITPIYDRPYTEKI